MMFAPGARLNGHLTKSTGICMDFFNVIPPPSGLSDKLHARQVLLTKVMASLCPETYMEVPISSLLQSLLTSEGSVGLQKDLQGRRRLNIPLHRPIALIKVTASNKNKMLGGPVFGMPCHLA